MIGNINQVQFMILDLERTRKRIIEQLTATESKLAGLKRNSSKRPELIEHKNALLAQLREQKIRINEARHIRLRTPRESAVTDHALARWLERKHKIDVTRLKDTMLTDGLRAALGSGQQHWSDGEMVFILQDSRVITVIPATEWGFYVSYDTP